MSDIKNNLKNFIKDGREAAAKAVIKVLHADLASGEKKNAGNPFFETCVKEHDTELADWKNPYGYWLRNDAWEKRAVSLSDDEGKITFEEYEYVYLCSEIAQPARGWKTAVREALEALKDAPIIIYGDEDVLDRDGANVNNGERSNPFFKPDFSPELLAQFNYLGEMVLIRKDILEKSGISADKFSSEATNSNEIYEILKSVTENLPAASFDEGEILKHFYKGVLHIPHILSHRISGSAEEDCKKAIEKLAGNAIVAENLPTLSIIIPTKDHPDILRTCISSIMEKTNYDLEKIEIIVVDNGSAPANKAQNEELAAKYSFKYIYDPQPFNYSRMNNMGAEKAEGELLLLLNDDTEVIKADWLRRMAFYASKPEIGAVGAKLLYANTEKIQHAGVTNMAVGPSHKILALEDSQDHYFGRNKLDYNMLAVTGACLLVSKKKFDEVGGLSEDLKVAYNDIDFCIKLFEHGYRSVQCNTSVLYHYESLTRGMDEGDEEKFHRLLAEKEKFYAAHPWAKGFDPFYNPNLIDNSSDYIPTTKDCTKNTDSFSKYLGNLQTLPKETFMVRARLDRIQKQLRNTEDAKDFIWLDGWSFVRGCDNRRFSKTFVLTDKESGEIRQYELFSTYRKDILAAFEKEDHIELAGFFFRLPVEELDNKEWSAGIIQTDALTGKQLYKDLGKTIRAK